MSRTLNLAGQKTCLDKWGHYTLLQVILILPKKPLLRPGRFHRGCCADASYVLADILSCINYLNIHTIICIEASDEKDNQMWIDCDGIAVDITYGLMPYICRKPITDEHPYLNKSGYKLIDTNL